MPNDPNNSSIDLVILESENEIALESIKINQFTCEGLKVVSLKLNEHEETACENITTFKNVNIDIKNITRLTLSSSQLTDVPDFVSTLKLRVLNLSHNCLRAVPQCVTNGLKLLENLDLSKNLITEFETEPQCAMKLRLLNLSSNRMCDIPLWILLVRSTNLEEFCYSMNNIGQTKESEYHNVAMYNLEKLELQNCDIKLDNYPFLKSICSLVNLNISNDPYATRNQNRIEECLFDHPTWKYKVEVLNLNNLAISFVPENIYLLSNIKELYLSANTLFCLPDCIANLKALEVLDISNNSIVRLPNSMNKLINLRELKMNSNSLSCVTGLDGFVNLKILDLYDNEIDTFECTIDNLEGLDVENNCFDTSTLKETYTLKKNSYRSNRHLCNRIDGARKYEASEQCSIRSESDDGYSADDEILHNYSTTIVFAEEECWDDTPTFTSHPDVTPSDDEWQGSVAHAKHGEKKQLPKMDQALFTLFVDAD